MTENITIDDKTYERVEVVAEKVKAGDLTILSQTEIKTVDVKTKYVYTTTVDGDTVGRMDIGQPLAVWRETEESRTARAEIRFRERLNVRVREWFSTYVERANTKAAFKKMDEILGRDGALVSDWELTAMVNAQAQDKVAARVHRAIRIFDEKVAAGEEHPAADLVGVVELIADSFRSELISGTRGLSRSTSIIHNAMEDADRAALADFLGKREFGGWFM